MADRELDDNAMGEIGKHSLRVMAAALVLTAVMVSCMYADGLLRRMLVVVFYVATVVGYFVGTQFDAAVEKATGPIAKAPKLVGLAIALLTSLALHRWLFWR